MMTIISWVIMGILGILGILFFCGCLGIKQSLRKKSYVITLIIAAVIFGLCIMVLLFMQLSNTLEKTLAWQIIAEISIGIILFNVTYLGVLKIITQQNTLRMEQILELCQMEIMHDYEKKLKQKIEEYQITLEQEFQMKLTKFQTQTYQEIAETLKEYREQVNEHLQNIWGQLKNKRDFSLKDYSREIISINRCLEQLYYTGDNIIDLVLFNKQIQALKQGIQLETNVALSSGSSSLDTSSIAVIIDNLLDNAIETVNRIKEIDGEKVIGLYMQSQEKSLEIKLENPLDEDLKNQDAILNYKVRIIEDFVKNCRGTMKVIQDDFYSDIWINLPYPGSASKEG